MKYHIKKSHGYLHILRDEGYPKLSVNRVSRLMIQLNIRAVTIRKFKNYRNKQDEHSELKNLVNQNFSAKKPNQMWLSDITYIHTVKHGWTYLASILDVCIRKIVAYSYGRKKVCLFDYINGFYKRRRIHSAINYLSPIKLEQMLINC